jgi:predicted nucleotidyltransferase
VTASHFPQDFLDIFVLLRKHGVRFLIVGAEAVIYHGYARLTGDIDLFYEPSLKNRRALFAALREFWSGEVPGIGSVQDLARKGMIIQFGYPPNRIDLLNAISGVTFNEAWKGRISENLRVRGQTIAVCYIGLAALIKNKKAVGRPKDLEDLKYLREAAKKTR